MSEQPIRLVRATIALGLIAGAAAGHGTPIGVEVVDDALRVSHPEDPYAPYVFGQQDEESDPQGPIAHPQLGRTLLWGLPGIDITGMADTSSLSLEFLAPRGPDGAGQSLWHYSAASRSVEPTPADAELRLLLADGGLVSLAGDDPTAPAPVVLADPVAGQTGYHNHGLLSFAMPYNDGLELGLYGFFGRLTSDSYSPSEWLFIVFNVGAAYEDLAPASDALWGAAFPGDYDRDGAVGAADYAAWTQQYGAALAVGYGGADGDGDGVVGAADFTVWRDALGGRAQSHAATPTADIVPAPAGAAVCLSGICFVTSLRRSVHASPAATP